ncbi:hypothetical protein ABMA32_03630 [Mesorhizobium sp. VNQ89]|uniref:hypothetical protein n=1 Tax=Mesorhizobium quangtriensis TaxID=3157709 RepID=UPI0032B86E1B
MTPDLQLMLFAAAATIAGNIVAALVIWRVIEWRKTRDWKNLLAPLGIGIWIAFGLSVLILPSKSPTVSLSLSLMICGGVIGALVSARALFGIVRYSRAETVLGNEPQYRGAMGDVFAFVVALAPVAAAAFLF